jgi:hypothetical protein
MPLIFASGTWEQIASTLSFAGNNSQQIFGSQGKLAATGSGSINFWRRCNRCKIVRCKLTRPEQLMFGNAGNKLEINSSGNMQLQNGTVNVGGRLFNNASLIITGGTV